MFSKDAVLGFEIPALVQPCLTHCWKRVLNTFVHMLLLPLSLQPPLGKVMVALQKRDVGTR